MPTLSERIGRVLPPSRILTGAADRAAYDSDAQTAFRCRAAAVVIPQSTDELVALVRWCHAEAVPFVVRGSGTGLSAAATPVSDGLVIVTTSLNRIRRIDPQQRIAVVEPGVVNAHVSRAAAGHGLFFAPDPSSQPICTIGGNIGFNAGGAHCLKYGMTSNHVLGLRAVLATGEVVEWGGASRDSIGPDWTGLFVGNEGLFGVVLEATLNLLPIPDGCHTVLAGFDSTEAAGDAVSAIIGSGLVPVAMELMDDLTIEAVRPVVPIDYPENCHALLLVELDGPHAIVQAERTQLETLLRDNHSTGLVIAQNAEERANIWRVRKSAYSAYGRFAPNNFVQDSVVPRRHLGEALRRVSQIAASVDLKCPNVCHAGDGNLHPNLLYDGEKPGELERAEKAAWEILHMCVELGGSITGEHGVGLEKRAFLPLMFGEAEIQLFRQIQACFDPSGIANPGKMFPDPETSNHRPESTIDPRIQELAASIKQMPRLQPIGAGSKVNAGSSPESHLSIQSLRGVTAYEPSEFVLTALAGTPLREIVDRLAAEGQQLLFDPMMVETGATLGGAVASGLNGPNAFGLGRIRDAMLGATFIDGRGEILQVGGKVVKNVAGFDLPKLFVGSLGSLGVLAEITLKVAPKAPDTQTFAFTVSTPAEFYRLLEELSTRTSRPIALDGDLNDLKIWARFDAPAGAISSLTEDLAESGAHAMPEAEAQTCWDSIREFVWTAPDDALIKIPTDRERIQDLVKITQTAEPAAKIHISLGGDVVFVSSPAHTEKTLRETLAAAGHASLGLRQATQQIYPSGAESEVSRRLKDLFDPEQRFPDLSDFTSV
ncbi:MAG: FAD-binding protein [Opitutaceae bacterium]|nr:FAD-binding protein [Opitutaceae bacterium]